jgi:hypothetical protein
MSRIAVNIFLIARSSTNVISSQLSQVALLGALLLSASLPTGSLAAVAGADGGSSQPVPSVRPGPGPAGAPHAPASAGRHLVLQVRGSG